MHRRTESSNARATEAAVCCPEEASEADMVANDNISRDSAKLTEAPEQSYQPAVAWRRAGVVLFEANDNHRRGTGHGSAGCAMGDNLHQRGVVAQIVQKLADLLKRMGFSIFRNIARAVMGRTRCGQCTTAGSHPAAAG